LQREVVRGVEPNIHGGERLKHQCKKFCKPPMLKMLKKVDEDNEGTNQMSVSEKSRERTRETQWRTRERQIMKAMKY